MMEFFRPFDPQYLHEEVRDEDDEENKARLKLRVRFFFQQFPHFS